MCGVTEIIISNTTPVNVGKFKNTPCFYGGKIRSGTNELYFTNACILAFDMSE